MKNILLSLFLGLGLAVLVSSAVTAHKIDRLPSDADVALGEPGLNYYYHHTIGVTGDPYPDDADHLNVPVGVSVDGGDNLYVVEEEGCRMLKFDHTGTNILTIGNGGICTVDEDYFNRPHDSAIDASGNIWVADNNRISQYDSSGNFLQMFPTEDNDPGDCSDDNQHFCVPEGIAFDGSGRVYVSDRHNHRVQVFSFVSDSPVYSATIGVTGEAGDDNEHLEQPFKIDIDSAENLYIVDSQNHRVQKCAYSSGWTCSTFHGTGSAGSGPDELSGPNGISVDSSDNVYIVDVDNERIKMCTPAGSCSVIISLGGNSGEDITVDSSGTIYTSDSGNHVVHEYASNYSYQGVFAGTSGTPYATDDAHLNHPSGIAIAQDGGYFIVEERGHRLIKYDANGDQDWVNDDDLNWPKGRLDVDALGRVYVPDTDNDRIQIYNQDGSDYDTLNLVFEPNAVAISPLNGDIYIVDHFDHEVVIYTSSLVFSTTIGVSGVSGSDNDHFNYPSDVAVDHNGLVYVCDEDNHRVQVFDENLLYQRTIGVTGEAGGDFDHLERPAAVTVDSQNRVFIGERDNYRIQVFDSTGAYLTTIGSSRWGSGTQDIDDIRDLAIDNFGKVYIADPYNQRVQVFAPMKHGWEQVNINGFGQHNRYPLALATFEDQLYAGLNPFGLWRYDGTWTEVMTDGFGQLHNSAIDSLFEFNDKLYAGTVSDLDHGSEIWRSTDGTTWESIMTGGFGDPWNAELFNFGEYDGMLYASTWSYTDTHGTQIFRSATGDVGSWSEVVANGFGDAYNGTVLSFEVYSNSLYAGTDNRNTGTEIWRCQTCDGLDWEQVNDDGFGDEFNWSASLKEYLGYLYAGTFNFSNSDNPGAELWRCQTCDGTDWTQVMIPKGFGDTDTRAIRSLSVFNGDLIAVTLNSVVGAGVWKTNDGENWTQTNINGFGDKNNRSAYYGNGVTIYDNKLFVGVYNFKTGGEIWTTLFDIHLPFVVR